MKIFFEPRSVVLIGVSRKTGPGAYNNLEMMLKYGYRGRIFVVHPMVPEILGHRTSPTVRELPEVPELAVISLGRDRVLPVFKECVEKGIRRVVVISQGFADADEKGKALQQELLETARQSRTRVVGPNTMGILNPYSRFSTAFVDIPRDDDPPPLAMVVQSGVFQVGFESFAGRLGKAIDIGNACDIDFVDVLDFLEDDPQTQIIVLHMETVLRGREFLQTASRIAASKPIIVFKTGRSEAGAKAALSHTGSLVGEDAVIDAAFSKAGLIRVRNMIELRAVCKAFLHFRLPDGPRLGVVTATGACGIITADACEDYRLELAPFPERIRPHLENSRIAWHRLDNPVDIWPLGMVEGSFTELFKRSVLGLLQDDRVDAVLGIAPTMKSPVHKDLDMISTVREINQHNDKHKPIALWLYGGDQCRQCEALEKDDGVACFASIDEAVLGLAALCRYRELKEGKESSQSRFGPLHRSAHRPVEPPRQTVLVGEQAFKLLRAYQIPVVPGKLVNNQNAAVSAAAELGYPVVLKVISPQWLHKSDLDGIRLNISGERELREAYGALMEAFQAQTPAGELEGILVQKHVAGIELLLGAQRDPQFGPVLVVGHGGIYTEVFRDVARTLLPLDSGEAKRLLQSLRIYPILEGIRGRKGVDLNKIIGAITALAQLVVDYPEIKELDLNPVLAGLDGCWCVDCRMVLD